MPRKEQRDHKMSPVQRPEVIRPKKHLHALCVRQCSAELRVEGLQKEGLELISKDRVKVNPASEFPGCLSGSLGHRWFVSKAGQKQCPFVSSPKQAPSRVHS